MTGPDLHLANKRFVRSALARIAEAGPAGIDAALAAAYHPDAQWRGSHPLNEMTGLAAIAGTVWRPLFCAFPDLERRDALMIGGDYDGHAFVGAVGHYCGTFREDWLTIPATGKPVYLRYGEFHRVVAGRIAQSTVLIDMLDVIRQAGFWCTAPSTGTEEQWPGPITGDGMSFALADPAVAQADPAVSEANFVQMRQMQTNLGLHGDIATLGREAMLIPSQVWGWHPKMMWYGPCGIGTTRGVQGFVDYHRMPFRRAFENTGGGRHYVRIADGAYTATSGWPSLTLKHAGGDFMGLGPTGRDFTMRVMDFYLHHEGLIRENWVPIDIAHVLLQLGVDVFACMRDHFRRGRLG